MRRGVRQSTASAQEWDVSAANAPLFLARRCSNPFQPPVQVREIALCFLDFRARLVWAAVRTGRPAASSADERRRVYELTDVGLSSRRVAEAVYGDPSLKDRVLRLLRRRRATAIRDVSLETATDAELDAMLARALEKLGD